MQLPVLHIPPLAPPPRCRQPNENIPQTRAERERIRALLEKYVDVVRPVPPLQFDELRHHADAFMSRHGIESKYRDYVSVLVNNAVWREQLASVPFQRRLLLLSKCLRVEDKCAARVDEFGLLCRRCGLCSIRDLETEAERLGYAVLVAEGSAMVMALIQTGKIDAIVGVSCLSVLERAFPYMESAAIPGAAIPLLQDDCRDTTVDLDWIRDVIHLTREDKTRRLDLNALREQVASWFEGPALDEISAFEKNDATGCIARDWIARQGKRWRPFLAACAWKALQDDPELPMPPDLRKIAVAVECFHKASLVHDDIEDGDEVRYGSPTLHAEYGVPVALNVGDLLIGEGYRLLAECGAGADVRGRMIQSAAAGHRTLCLGQGAELLWARSPEPLALRRVLDIFRRKTAPAFQVALELGAAYAGAGPDVFETLTRYSEALGIAYQIRDDLHDWQAGAESADFLALRPTLPLAIAYESAKGNRRSMVESAWRREQSAFENVDDLRRLMDELGVAERMRGLLFSYKEEAVRSLTALEHTGLKSLLRRVVGKIFAIEVRGWCSEFETRDAAGRQAGAPAAS